MLIFKIWNYIKGYVIIRIKGNMLERFLNLINLEKITIWDIQKLDEDVIKLKINSEKFKSIRHIARKTRTSVTIMDKKGFPFLYKKLLKRKSLLVGLILFLAIQLILSNIVWDINVIGNNKVPMGKILSNLKESGLKTGVLKYKIDQKNIINNLILHNPEIAWAGIKIKGTKVILTVVERSKIPELEDNEPCNIIAIKDGIIEEIIILKGEGVVKKGDLIRKGQTLIKGINEDNDTGNYLVHAKGIVKARIFYNEKTKVQLTKIIENDTGLTSLLMKIKFKNYEIPIKRIGPVFNKYRSEIDKKTIFRCRNILGFVELITEKQYEIKEEKIFIGIEGACDIGKDILNEKIMRFIPEDSIVLTKKFEKLLLKDESALEIRLTVETIENIGLEQKILQQLN